MNHYIWVITVLSFILMMSRLAVVLPFYDTNSVARLNFGEKSSIISSNTVFNSAITLVFIIGIEGVGHHFVSDLLKDSPNMRELNELGLCDDGNPVAYGLPLMKANAHSSDFDKLVSGMIELDQIVKNRVQEHQAGSSFHIAINANGCHDRMASYPSNLNENRHLDTPNVDIFYDACEKAQVNCKHIYLYRDPYDIISSTTVKRKFNADSREAIRTYTLMSQYIYSQLSYYSDKTLLCFGPLDVHGYKRQTDWDKFGLIFGWKSADDFRTYVNGINKKSEIVPYSESEKLKLVPEKWSVYIKAYEDIHARVTNLCYSQSG